MTRPLTAEQLMILKSRSFRQGEGYSCAQWIAEECRRPYETGWASGKIPTLIKRGLIEKGGRGWYRLTNAGREAAAATGDAE